MVIHFNPLIYTDCKQMTLYFSDLQGANFNPLIYTDCKGVVENSSTHLIPVFGFCEPH